MASKCGPCSKPAPLGRPVPGQQPKSIVASQSSGIFHVAPNGQRTRMGDLLAARAAVIRSGGSIENS